MEDTTIFASGNLDEYRLQALLSSNAPINGFGIGTALDISCDVPSLDCAYKLQEYAGKARRKHSEGKATWPGRKQVYRKYSADDYMAGDIVALEENDPQEGQTLIQPVMHAGRRLHPTLSIHKTRHQTIANYRHMLDSMITLDSAPIYPVKISTALQVLVK